MTMWTSYEWDIETIARQTACYHGDEEVLDHHHAEKLSDYADRDFLAENEPYEYNILVLVRDSGPERLWAYVDVTNDTLPEFFFDAWQLETAVKVPQRFHTEIARWRKKRRKCP